MLQSLTLQGKDAKKGQERPQRGELAAESGVGGTPDCKAKF